MTVFEGFDEPLPVNPPEVREPQERFRMIEFYVDIAEPRPEIALFELVTFWLRDQAPLVTFGLSISYQQPGQDGAPGLLIGQLLVGEPLDLG